MAAPRPRTTTDNRRFLGRLSLPERNFVAEALRTETVGGVLLLLAAIAALIWANTPCGTATPRWATSTSVPEPSG